MSNDRLGPFNYHNIAFKRCADVVSLGRPDRLWFFRHHWFVKIGWLGKNGVQGKTCWTDLLAFRGVWNRSRILNFGPDRLFFRFSRALPHPLLIFSQSDYLIQIVDINPHTKWQTVQFQVTWLLQKLTDLDLHCFQRQGISGLSRTRVKVPWQIVANSIFRCCWFCFAFCLEKIWEHFMWKYFLFFVFLQNYIV